MQSKNARSAQLAGLLKRLAQKVATMSDEELTLFLSGESAAPRSPKDTAPPQEQKELETLIEELRSLKSKEDGRLLLQRRAPTRASLVLVARRLDLPVSKRDTVEQLNERIVDTTIGYRTRSAAIRGNDVEPQ